MPPKLSFTRLECTAGTSNKFWECAVNGSKTVTRYGKLGTSGVEQHKDHGSNAAANAAQEKMVAAKAKKNYVKITGSGAKVADALRAPSSAVTQKMPPSRVITAPSTGTTRTFERYTCTAGTSNKFWEVAVEGKKTFARYGRIGTEGVVQEKDHPTTAAAADYRLKMINEKLKKHYTKVVVPAPPTTASASPGPAAAISAKGKGKRKDRDAPSATTTTTTTTTTTAAAAASSTKKKRKTKKSNDPRPVCEYGSGCYRTSPWHLIKFQHPEEDEDEDGEGGGDAMDQEESGDESQALAADDDEEMDDLSDLPVVTAVLSLPPPTPVSLADGESRQVTTGGSVYEIKFIGGVYSCNCPGWRFQSAGIDKRSCKHLKLMRGADVEAARGGGVRPRAKVTAGSSSTASGAGSGSGSSSALAVLLAKPLTVEDVTNWWLSEKLDGVRAYWNGTLLASRTGNEFFAPKWFTDALPASTHLDGELWIDRGEFQKTVSVVRRQDGGDAWKAVRYLVFDAPNHAGDFEARLKHVNSLFPSASPAGSLIVDKTRVHASASPVVAVAHVPCTSPIMLKDTLKEVEHLGGEGLMARQPHSAYERCRSSSLLKVKSFLEDDALVIGHEAGKGKHEGRCGALKVKLANGKTFKVGTGLSDAQRENPPKIGAVVSFKYQELSKTGIPRFPSYIGERIDVVWTHPT